MADDQPEISKAALKAYIPEEVEEASDVAN